jgi:hypothetical protein
MHILLDNFIPVNSNEVITERTPLLSTNFPVVNMREFISPS